MRYSMTHCPVVFSALTVAALLAAGCSNKDVRKATPEELIASLDSDSPAERMEASKQLANQGEAMIPKLMEVFSKAEGKPQVQEAAAEAVFRMPATDTTISTLQKMASQTKDTATKERIAGFVQQRQGRHRANP